VAVYRTGWDVDNEVHGVNIARPRCENAFESYSVSVAWSGVPFDSVAVKVGVNRESTPNGYSLDVRTREIKVWLEINEGKCTHNALGQPISAAKFLVQCARR
jgi:hypothetical protein